MKGQILGLERSVVDSHAAILAIFCAHPNPRQGDSGREGVGTVQCLTARDTQLPLLLLLVHIPLLGRKTVRDRAKLALSIQIESVHNTVLW